MKIIALIREAGYSVLSITESHPGIVDIDILALAVKNGSIILTFDKDFGELVFHENKKPSGIMLLRFKPKSVNHIAERIFKALPAIESIQDSSFAVIEEDKIRIRMI